MSNDQFYGSMFPNASQSTKQANPQIFGDAVAIPQGDCKRSDRQPATLTLPTNKNDSTAKALPKKSRSMNKTEAQFALILEGMKQKGEIDGWKFEAVTLKLADGCRYTPDFMSCGSYEYANDTVIFYEVKGGFIRDDAAVKFKVAREQFPWASFEMWQKSKDGWKQIL